MSEGEQPVRYPGVPEDRDQGPAEPTMSGRRPLFYNPATLLGSGVALAALALVALLVLIEYYSSRPHPYMGIFAYMLLPMVLNAGLFLAVIGLVRARRRRLAGMPQETAGLYLDFGRPQHRSLLLRWSAGGIVFFVMTAFGTFKAYTYTESVEFCGRACHAVMKPEYVAYLGSPHARVACVQCHIGPGATWFVKSKLSGSYQVYSVLFHKYRRPIETPIANLRPARETCEQCHWPKQFYSAKLQSRAYFASDEANTRSQTEMLLKIGGGNPAHGATEGIHFHMFLDAQISYVARDEKRSVIPYVECKYPDGRVEVFRSTDEPLSDAEISRAKKHIVDCIECHNRPSHIYHNPAQSVNLALSQGWISPTLPEVKRLLVETLEKPYKSERDAVASIDRSIRGFYQASYPAVASARGTDVAKAVKQAQTIYTRNYFPEMRVNWKTHPDHMGHMYSPGCFRCHDGKHKSDSGKVLSRDCQSCHTIVSQSVGGGRAETSMKGVPFRHPVDIGDAWKETNCSDCHAPTE